MCYMRTTAVPDGIYALYALLKDSVTWEKLSLQLTPRASFKLRKVSICGCENRKLTQVVIL